MVRLGNRDGAIDLLVGQSGPVRSGRTGSLLGSAKRGSPERKIVFGDHRRAARRNSGSSGEKGIDVGLKREAAAK